MSRAYRCYRSSVVVDSRGENSDIDMTINFQVSDKRFKLGEIPRYLGLPIAELKLAHFTFCDLSYIASAKV